MGDRSVATPVVRANVAIALVSVGIALCIIGPGLGPGLMLNLDLVVVPDVPMPRGVWGLGPELPRRVPLFALPALLSPLGLGGAATRLLLVASVAGAIAGASVLARRCGADRLLWQLTAGIIYGTSPFLLTRIGVGHLMISVAVALLPWALPTLAAPARRPAATFLWAAALGLTGFYGGMVALMVVVVGLATQRAGRSPTVLALTVAAQAPWLLPGLVLWGRAGGIADGAWFGTAVEWPLGPAWLAAGHGFWQPGYQVGVPDLYTISGPLGWVVALCGVVLVGFAALGTSSLPRPLRTPMLVLAGLGYTLALISVVPGLDGLWADFTGTAVGASFREGQRFLPLFTLWLAPAAALGAREAFTRWGARVGGLGSVVAVVPLVVAILLAGPGWWGIGGQLRPLDVPDEWAEARSLVREEPGTVLALPWAAYFDVSVGEVAPRVTNPLPIFLGGDVLVSSDVGFGSPPERADPREPVVDRLMFELRSGNPVGEELATLGVRWVVLLKSLDWLRYEALDEDPRITQVLDGPTLALYEVEDALGPLVDIDGGAVQHTSYLEPLLWANADTPFVWHRAGEAGWRRGWTSAGVTEEGTLRFDGEGSLIWYAPAVLVLVGVLAWSVGLGWALRSVLRARRSTAPRVLADGPYPR